ncbi:MAG: hypothetical protein ACFE0Q_20680 [Anaerolineae bacterium]
MSEPKTRKCDSDGCILPATHKLVWMDWQYYCSIHINHVLGLSEFMGFPVPANTVAKLTPDEMILDDEGEDEES